MKKICLLACLVSHIGHAQVTSFGNFKTEEQEIIYQKVFIQDSVTVARLEKYYTSLDYISNVSQATAGIQFDMNDISVDDKKFQFNQVGTPNIIQTGQFSGKVTIESREGRYRVTVRNIQMTGDIGYKKIAARENLTAYATRNSGTQLHPDWCKPNMLGLLDQAFTDKLQFSGKSKDDW